jgi:ADP-ribosylglycohydrolase
MRRPTDIAARARGCLLGQLAGDSLGSLVEFQTAEQIAARYPDGVRELAEGGTWGTLAGQPTDDSELALALARALVARGEFHDETVTEAYVRWYSSAPFDIGSTTSQALSAAAAAEAGGRASAARRGGNAGSQANGALMRVSPLAIFGYAAPPEILENWAEADACLTHRHLVCREASAVFTVAVAYAIRTGAAPRETYDYIVRWAAEWPIRPEIQDALRAAAESLPADYVTQMGWVRIALHNAFYQLLHAATLEAGVIDTVRRGGDTDTNAAIAGALLGAAYGEAAIPSQWRHSVLNCRPQAGNPRVRRPRPQEYWPVDALELAEALLTAGERLVQTKWS